ncbi:Protein saf4 [Saxophila tyrrhenica]|uniref:Protein saf4 n=1 Tax=Saxophila tyrrhenica TaxID=1690608 RepID=A0AAV9P6L5_9PEZI|nr:Protein saf4 [Saxophila tyrrhenica]
MQGFNMGRYIPPDAADAGATSGNRIHQKRAPGTLRKDGTQTVRFELPYAVWCHTCSPHAIIGQGVRFNAEKKKVGYYYSTPIWQFRMKHAACGGTLEVRTDPKNTAYVVTEGGKARDYGEDKVREGEGGVEILTEAERERRRKDAFALLEGKVEGEQAVKDNKRRIEELCVEKERDWGDTWSANKRVRDAFRRERKVRKREEERTEQLKERIGSDMDLLPESEEDARRARLVDFGGGENEARSQPFMRKTSSLARSTKSQKLTKADRTDALRRQLLSNTRAAMNPFDKDGAFP